MLGPVKQRDEGVGCRREERREKRAKRAKRAKREKIREQREERRDKREERREKREERGTAEQSKRCLGEKRTHTTHIHTQIHIQPYTCTYTYTYTCIQHAPWSWNPTDALAAPMRRYVSLPSSIVNPSREMGAAV